MRFVMTALQDIQMLRALCLAVHRGDATLQDELRSLTSSSFIGAPGSPLKSLGIEDLGSFQGVVRILSDAEMLARCQRDIEVWAERGIGGVCWFEPEYPELLRHIYAPPVYLTVRGTCPASLNSLPCISIVGARNCDRGGIDTARAIAASLAQIGVVVVSGLAAGVDTAAHQGALLRQSVCPTIAVIGSGLDALYPRSNERLAQEIVAQNGLVVSQFEPEVPPYPANFLNRNRIIAGISRAVVVVQARDRSGSLVTARYANEEGRDVFAVPGDVRDGRYNGTNALIRQGATLVRSGRDVIDAYPDLAARLPEDPKSIPTAFLREVQKQIVDLVGKDRGITVAQLSDRLGTPAKFQENLLELELNGIVRRAPGDRLEMV